MIASSAAKLLSLLAIFTFSYGSFAVKRDGLIRKSEIPNSGQDWVSLPSGVEFQPALDENDDPRVAAAMDEARGRFLGSSYSTQFVDGTETYYDPYSQAWRLLGFYIDCNAQQDGGRRRLEEDGDGEDGDGDEVCTRMLLWAAVS